MFFSYYTYAQTDPNNDPNWDWTASSTFTHLLKFCKSIAYKVHLSFLNIPSG